MNAATAQNFELLRFDANELNDIRGGFLSSSVKAKFKQRLKNYGNLLQILYSITGVIFAVCAAPILCMFGFAFLTASRTPRLYTVVPIFFVLAFVAVTVGAIVLWSKFKRKVSQDLKGMRVDCAEGRIKIEIKTTRHNHSFNYSIGATNFKILSDFIGAEIHQELVGGIMAPKLAESEKVYRVYYLPESKMILHYEAIG